MPLLDSTPVLIGGGQVTDRNTDLEQAKSRLDLMEEAVRLAAADARIAGAALQGLDRVTVIPPFPRDWMDNPPEALAHRLGADSAQRFAAGVGGCLPQFLVNQTAELIARGEAGFALFAGAEAEDTRGRFRKADRKPTHWRVTSDTRPEAIGYVDDSVVSSALETRHGTVVPAAIYPMFESALRGHYRRTPREHTRALGRLCSRLCAVAADNPLAWFREAHSPGAITTPSSDNRYTAYPYTKRMNAMPRVNQAAAVLMTSVGKAKQLGIPQQRWVFLHGCGDAHDHWHVSRRVDYHSSPAIRQIGQTALSMARLSIDEIDHLDIYSCFPVAVEVGRDMLAIAHDDPRPLTITGGLPYFGGPGNNYTMHSIAAMLELLRAQPGTTGLVTGNSYYLSRHSIGVYSTRPTHGQWSRTDPALDQATVDAHLGPDVVDQPGGTGRIEAYTVTHDREGKPERGIIIGRLDAGARFLAHTPQDEGVLHGLMEQDALQLKGTLSQDGPINRFTPEG